MLTAGSSTAKFHCPFSTSSPEQLTDAVAVTVSYNLTGL